MPAWRRLADIVRDHGAAALVTLHGAKGSVPREAGARMIVRPDGAFHGTIGGGRLEWEMLQAAQESLAQGRGAARFLDQVLGPDLGQCCGGWVRVLVETFDRTDVAELEALAGVEAGEIVCSLDAEGRVARHPSPTPLGLAREGQSDAQVGNSRLAWGEGQPPRRRGQGEGAVKAAMLSPPPRGEGPGVGGGPERGERVVRPPSPVQGEGGPAKRGRERVRQAARDALGEELGQESEEEGALFPRHSLSTPAGAGATLSLDGRGERHGGLPGPLSLPASGRLSLPLRGGGGAWREPLPSRPTPLLLFGAGHVGRAIVLALAPLPFAIRWIDPREGAHPPHIPANATPVRTPAPEAELAAAPPDAFVLVMTHEHPLDLALTAAALSRPFPFVGLIGSDTKRARFERRLRDLGTPEGRIRALVCPIGVPGIAGKEPAIIAAATAAQLLAERERLAALPQSPPMPHNIRHDTLSR